MDFRDVERQMARNRARREFLSVYSVAEATKSLREKLDRLETSLSRDDVEGQIEALSDIIVCCLGGLETFGCETERILREIASEAQAGARLAEDSNGGRTGGTRG